MRIYLNPQMNRHRNDVNARYLLIHAAGQEASIHREGVACDEAGGFGGQEHRAASHFMQLPKALHWRSHFQFGATWCSIQQACV